MPKSPARDPIAVIRAVTARRLLREGICPILEVTVTYPWLESETPAAARFNRAYRDAAESFLEWAEVTPYEEAKAAFASLGAAAPYRFDRRVLTCAMTAAFQDYPEGAEGEARPTRLTVTRAACLTSRRGEVPERRVAEVDLWRWPELTAAGTRYQA